MSVKVTKSPDWAKFRKRLARVGKNIGQLVKAVQNEATPIRSQMQVRARVRTGFMRDHIIESYIALGFIIHSMAPYSGFQEFGTRFITPNLFFRPPLEVGWTNIQNSMIRTLVSPLPTVTLPMRIKGIK